MGGVVRTVRLISLCFQQYLSCQNELYEVIWDSTFFSVWKGSNWK